MLSLLQCRFKSLLRKTEVKAFKELLVIPKKPNNQYSLFYKEKFATLKSQSPSTSVPELAKAISSQWKSLPSNEKASYIDKSAELRKQYSAVKESFDSRSTPGRKLLLSLLRYNRSIPVSYTHEKSLEIKRGLRTFRKQFPEGPLTSKGLFFKEKLTGKKIEGKSTKETMTAWMSLSPDEKAKYDSLSRDEFEKYKQSLGSFISTN